MKNRFFIFAFCVSAVFVSCRHTQEVRRFNPTPLSEELAADKDHHLIVLLDNSPSTDYYLEELQEIFDSLGKGIKIIPFSVKAENGFVVGDSLPGSFEEKVGNGYLEVNAFQVLLKHLEQEIPGEKILVMVGPGIIPHHKSYLPEINEVAKNKNVQIHFLFFGDTGSRSFSMKELEKEINKMHYPVQYIFFNGVNVQQYE